MFSMGSAWTFFHATRNHQENGDGFQVPWTLLFLFLVRYGTGEGIPVCWLWSIQDWERLFSSISISKKNCNINSLLFFNMSPNRDQKLVVAPREFRSKDLHDKICHLVVHFSSPSAWFFPFFFLFFLFPYWYRNGRNVIRYSTPNGPKDGSARQFIAKVTERHSLGSTTIRLNGRLGCK